MSVPNYERKAELLKDGKMISVVKKINRAEYADFALHEYGQIVRSSFDLKTAMEKRMELCNDEDFKECNRIVDCEKKRKGRIRSFVQDIISCPDSTFVTLTFAPEFYDDEKIDSARRRKYVRRYLKRQSNGAKFVANVDWGEKNGREHYHAVCAFRVNPKKWKYGILNVEKIRAGSNPQRLTVYLDKLTNHAIKETARRSVVMYSR